MSLPVVSPAEVLSISPENLEIANAYLTVQDIAKVANELDIPRDLVATALDRREVQAYIDRVFNDVGFNNRFLMRDAMDAVLRKKFQELEDSDTGSSKDIADLLALSHKMTMDALNAQIKLEQIRAGNSNIKNQTNVQINGGSNYNNLIDKLIKNNV